MPLISALTMEYLKALQEQFNEVRLARTALTISAMATFLSTSSFLSA
jgi:hypothetical protein